MFATVIRARDLQAKWLLEARATHGGGWKTSRTTGRTRPIWTQAQMSAWLRDHGVPVDDATYRQWETGYKPVTAEYLRVLEPLLGQIPEPEPEPPTESQSIAAAIREQTAAIERQNEIMADLVAELRASRETAPAAADRPSPEFLSAIVAAVAQGLALAQAENAGATPHP